MALGQGDVDLDPSVSIIQPQQLLNSWNPPCVSVAT